MGGWTTLIGQQTYQWDTHLSVQEPPASSFTFFLNKYKEKDKDHPTSPGRWLSGANPLPNLSSRSPTALSSRALFGESCHLPGGHKKTQPTTQSLSPAGRFLNWSKHFIKLNQMLIMRLSSLRAF